MAHSVTCGPAAARQWTPAQRDAITHAGGGLLVSAAAGSGKTSVLAERCVHVVCDAADRCDVHQLLVVTFTEAAAAEMKGRIGRALADRHAKGPGDYTARQLANLDRASISTLHAFCARLLRQHFHLVGLDPAFRIFDGDESAMRKREVAAELFAQRYADATDVGRAFRSLVDHYADGQDGRLVEEVIAAHETLCSVVDPAAWTAAARGRLVEAAEGTFHETALGREFIAGLQRELAGLQRECEAAGRFVKSLGGFDGYVNHLREAYTVVKHLTGVLDTHGLAAMAGEVVDLPRLAAVKSTVPNKELAKDRVDAVNRLYKDGPWRKRLLFTEADWRAGTVATLPHADALLSLVDAFATAYTAAKDEAGGLDFNDLERLTLGVLSDGGDRPSAVARAYHGQFRHVLVDEFQDINAVQDAILRRVSRDGLDRPGESNLFCVGDVKQSIYRFRLADPAQFIARRAAYLADAGRGSVIDLQQNFRSRGPLLDAVNGFFRKLMTLDAADVDYDRSQELVVGATFPPASPGSFVGSPVELHLLPTDVESADADGETAELDRLQREAVLVGHRILEVVGRRGAPAATVVDCDGTVRPAGFGDCVVLLRAMRFKADTVATQLRAMGVPVHSESSTGYFAATEVNDVLSLLRVLDNGRQDVPLASVLRSPLGNVSEDALAQVRARFPDVEFHAAVRQYAAEPDELGGRLRTLLDKLDAWRRVARDRPVAELLWTVYDQTGYLAYCGGLPRGDQRQANLVELHDKARQFGEFRRQGLGKFLAFLERLRAESDLGQASVASEADDVVRVMSIHRSKGLEFPVVFVPDLGKGFNVADLNGSVLLDRDRGLGLRVVDEARQVRYPSLAWTVVQQRMRQQTLAEELRVLYVALTRAKEHLVLVGTTADASPELWRQQWADHDGPIPAEAVLAGRTPLDWLGPAAAGLPDHVRVNAHSADDVTAWAAEGVRPPDLSASQAARADLLPIDPAPPPSPAAAAVIDRLGTAYPFESLSKIPAANSVTTLAKPPTTTTDKRDRVLDRPKFLAGDGAVQATDRGTATHAVLEHLDFAAATDAAAVRAAVEKLVHARRLTRPLADAVDVDAILWLMSTEVGGRLRRHSHEVRREVPVYFAHRPTGTTAAADDPMDSAMARGRVDLLVPDEAGGWTIVDYKTDRVSGTALDDRVAVYAEQLRLYRRAIATITGKPVSSALLVFLDPRQVRAV